jgi:hypothetical protein
MTDMRYMDRLGAVVADAVGLIREKSLTYQDSWKRRGGPGAWFTVVRPWDRLETIVAQHGGDIFAAIEADTTGRDGSALACVRDILNYMILIEAEGRAILGVGTHGPGSPLKTVEDVRREQYPPGTPDDGGHHALEPAGEVTEDATGAGGSAVPLGHADVRVRLGGFENERTDEFLGKVRELAGWLGITVTLECRDTIRFEA